MRRVSGLIVSLPRVPQTHNSTRRSLDRKSTRLNSSHQIISYAVFCLKKKKKCQNSSQKNICYTFLCLKKKRQYITYTVLYICYYSSTYMYICKSYTSLASTRD